MNQFVPPQGLFEKVMMRIAAQQLALSMRRRFALVAVGLAGLLALSIPMWHAFLLDLSHSGLQQYLGLAFHDFRTVAADWQDFGLILAESLPAVTTAGLLAVVFGLLVMVKFVIKYSKGLFV